jgi:hypothetical protein
MTTTGLVVLAVRVLAAALVATFATLAGFVVIGERHRRRQGRRARARAAAVDALTTGSDARGDAGPAVRALRALTIAEARSVLSELAASFDGASLATLRSLAASLGLIDRDKAGLRSRRLSRRLTAARFLTMLGVTSDDIARLLRDRHPSVRAQAAVWAAAHPTEQTLDAVAALLSDPDGRCRFEAKDTLARLGRRATPLLTRLLASTDAGTVTASLEIAAVSSDPAYVPAAARLARAGTAVDRALAATVLASSGGPAAVETLRDMLDDPHSVVRRAAVSALAARGDWPAAPLVAARLDDPSSAVREDAGLALLRLGAPGIVLLRDAARAGGEGGAMATLVLEVHDSTTPRGAP